LVGIVIFLCLTALLSHLLLRRYYKTFGETWREVRREHSAKTHDDQQQRLGSQSRSRSRRTMLRLTAIFILAIIAVWLQVLGLGSHPNWLRDLLEILSCAMFVLDLIIARRIFHRRIFRFDPTPEEL
jgi:predicted nucleic acid-binding Zn ribbon protein